MDADSFRVFRVFRGYVPLVAASPAVAYGPEIFGRRFLSDELWDAEGAGANRAGPLGLALGFLVC